MERSMGLILAPLAPDKIAIWLEFIQTVEGPRRADFDDFNRRYNLTRHDAWLCETPAGTFVVAIHEGPGAAEVTQKVAQSKHDFDVWFTANLARIHGMDLTKPPPGKKPERKLAWSA
jgi:hypothetical protein